MGARQHEISVSGRPEVPVVMARWVLVIGLSCLLLYGPAAGATVIWPHQAIILGLLLSNLLLHLLLWRGGDWKKWRWTFIVGDIFLIPVVVSLVETDTVTLSTICFAALLAAIVVPRVGAVVLLGALAASAYVAELYLQFGDALFREPGLLVRVPVLVGVAVYFGSVLHEARADQERAAKLEHKIRQISDRAKQLAREHYRLQALSEIGRLGLSGVRADPGGVLFEIIQRVQKVVGVDRASLVIFERDGDQAYVAASGDDPSVEVRVLRLEEYPELQVSLQRGEITELYPGRPKELWRRVQQQLPPANPFRSFLIVPIQRGNRLLGAIYLRDVRPDRRYSGDDRSFCATAAMMTAAFLHGQDMLEQLRTQSRRDGLTGLLNFQAFTEAAADVLRRAARKDDPYSLVVADLDNLKEVNDRWGHMTGNRLIITAGREFAGVLPDAIAVCRYGGDEFVAMVPGRKQETADRLSAYLARLDANPTDLPGPPRISIGIAGFPEDGFESDALLDAADQAMYLAKNGGGHCIQLAGRSEDVTTGEYDREVLEAVVSVQARRYLPDRDESVRDILAPLAEIDEEDLEDPRVRETLEVLMDAVEAKDPYTHAHSRAVARLARSLAEAMRLRRDQCTAVEMAGLVHDVGKIGVPDEILGKEGRLSTAERRVVERHPEIAAQLLDHIPPLRSVVPLVFHHQERWDGSGYPTGLSGNEIPLGAQVVALCDAYDALTSARAFRSALTVREARGVIERDAGILWNPEIVRVFLDDVVCDEAAALPATGS